MRTWYQTAAIDYPNGDPHIGHAFEKVNVDIQRRYRWLTGEYDDVRSIMGMDENTQKVVKKARELLLDPQVFCRGQEQNFRAMWNTLGIRTPSVDFRRTSSDYHHAACRNIAQLMHDKGYIYRGTYSGHYCPGCEEWKTKTFHDENEGKCPHHGDLAYRSDPCWMFRLSDFKDRIIELVETGDFLQPECRREEILNRLKNDGLRDLCISRPYDGWGVRFPFDESSAMYVWFDALLCYIMPVPPEQIDVHFIGKDIVWFHAVVWPAMLWAAGLQAPKKVFAHGFVTSADGDKASKSKGNGAGIADELVHGPEPFRLYMGHLWRESGADVVYERKDMEDFWNRQMVNNLGNLVGRVAGIIQKKFDGKVRALSGQVGQIFYSEEFDFFMREFNHHRALGAIFQNASDLNRSHWLADSSEYGWTKDGENFEIDRCVHAIRGLAIALKPFVPQAAQRIFLTFNFKDDFDRLGYRNISDQKVFDDEFIRVNGPFGDNGKLIPLFDKIGG